jgi:hypothetical protein
LRAAEPAGTTTEQTTWSGNTHSTGKGLRESVDYRAASPVGQALWTNERFFCEEKPVVCGFHGVCRCPLCRRGWPDVACQCTGLCTGWKESRSAGRPTAIGTTAKGKPSGRIGHFSPRSLARRRRTIGETQGLFLRKTWRLHPAICGCTSEVFHEGRLVSIDGLERQSIDAAAPFSGAGLWLVPVVHEGNQSYSVEEVARVADIVEYLTQPGTRLDRPPRPAAQLGPNFGSNALQSDNRPR